jgi:Domain of unknown function (DUF4167)
MRSSKSRSRSKQNRSRSVGNIVNRVFDSSGPEGKVRGTPQQIIDKYNQLARDAQLGNDRVAAENFQQHSEHYTRLLGEALRELEMQRQANQGGDSYGGQSGGQAGQNGNGYGGNGGGQNGGQTVNQTGGQTGNQSSGQTGGQHGGQQSSRNDRRREAEERAELAATAQPAEAQPEIPAEPPVDAAELPAFVTQTPRPAAIEAMAVEDSQPVAESGLVETPENSAPKPKSPRARRPRKTEGAAKVSDEAAE